MKPPAPPWRPSSKHKEHASQAYVKPSVHSGCAPSLGTVLGLGDKAWQNPYKIGDTPEASLEVMPCGPGWGVSGDQLRTWRTRGGKGGAWAPESHRPRLSAAGTCDVGELTGSAPCHVLTYKMQLTFPVSDGCCEIKVSHTCSAQGMVDAQQVPLPPGRWGAFNKRDKYHTRSVGIVTCSFSSWWSFHNVTFSVYSSVRLISTCTFLCISSPELFSSGKTETLHPWNNNSPFPPSLSPWRPPFYFLPPLFLLLGISYKWIIPYLSFGVGLISLSIRSLRFIHAVARVRIVFLFQAELYSIVCPCHILFISFSVDGHRRTMIM